MMDIDSWMEEYTLLSQINVYLCDDVPVLFLGPGTLASLALPSKVWTV